MKTKYYWDSDTIEDLKGETGYEVFRHVYMDTDWEDLTDLADVFSDLVKAINNVK